MSKPGSGAEHRGLLFRGADGSLWFMRDDSNKPEKLDRKTTDRINELLRNVGQRRKVTYALPRAVIDLLNDRFGQLQSNGVIHQISWRD
jgi:hypothetical protein